MTDQVKKGKLIVISGPSGVGKSTICAEVVNRLENVYLSVSATTRPRGNGEVDGQNYFFLSKEQFQQQLQNDEFLENAEVFGHRYGTPWAPIKQSLDEGKSVLLEIDVQGGMSVKRIYEDVIMVFILPPSPTDLRKRMNGRDRGENEEAEKTRLELASQELAAAWQSYDHLVSNEVVEQAIEEVISIIQSEPGENK